MSTVLRVIALLLIANLSAGCNTMRGVGKDTQKVGEKIEEEADSQSKKSQSKNVPIPEARR